MWIFSPFVRRKNFKAIEKILEVEESQVVPSQTGKGSKEERLLGHQLFFLILNLMTVLPKMQQVLPLFSWIQNHPFSPPLVLKQVLVVLCHNLPMKIMLENTFVYDIINTLSYPMLVRIHEFVKRVSIVPITFLAL